MANEFWTKILPSIALDKAENTAIDHFGFRGTYNTYWYATTFAMIGIGGVMVYVIYTAVPDKNL